MSTIMLMSTPMVEWAGLSRRFLSYIQEHSHGEAHVDRAMETSERGVWALKVSLMGLGATALFQLVIVILSGSVGLLADSIHNIADAFTAVPLWIAFAWARRPASRSNTYGYGRAEDVAGVVIVLMIFLSSLLAAYESSQKLLHPEPLRDVGWVMRPSETGDGDGPCRSLWSRWQRPPRPFAPP